VSLHSVYELPLTYPTHSTYPIFGNIRGQGDFSPSHYSIQHSIVQLVGATAESPSGEYQEITVLRNITPPFVETDVSEEASAHFLRMRVVLSLYMFNVPI
jgi:hypothetical protein